MRKFEIRGVWYTGPNRVESYPRDELDIRTADYGRPPNAIGIYERLQDGSLVHVTDEPDVLAADKFLDAFLATLNMVRQVATG